MKLKDVKIGELFQLYEGPNKTIYVRDEYNYYLRKYFIHKWDDVKVFKTLKGDTEVYEVFPELD